MLCPQAAASGSTDSKVTAELMDQFTPNKATEWYLNGKNQKD